MTENISRHFSIQSTVPPEPKFFYDTGVLESGVTVGVNEVTELEFRVEDPLQQIQKSIDEASGQIEHIVVSSQIAVALFNEGVITLEHFDNKVEDDNSLTLRNVDVNGKPFTLMIRDDTKLERSKVIVKVK